MLVSNVSISDGDLRKYNPLEISCLSVGDNKGFWHCQHKP